MTTTVFSTSVISDDADPIFTYAESGDAVIVNAGVTVSAKDRTVVARPGWTTCS
ncbi:MAG: hypothetical protein QM699_11010 [Amaricoccus sp.]|uniref:hypothetical protein n=1 Tax=Amaricoccus sp. TaxID=1872485 RepID=UPI0039E6EEF0